MSEVKLTPAERLAVVEEKAKRKREAIEEAREEQYATDREAIVKLEEELGIEIHFSKQVRQYVPGLPVIVGMRAPSEGEYKRVFSKMNNTKAHSDAKVAAHVELAQVCWVYPEASEIRKAMIAANSGLLASVGNFAHKLAEVEILEEGKD